MLHGQLLDEKDRIAISFIQKKGEKKKILPDVRSSENSVADDVRVRST